MTDVKGQRIFIKFCFKDTVEEFRELLGRASYAVVSSSVYMSAEFGL